jgi:hypothetical protein
MTTGEIVASINALTEEQKESLLNSALSAIASAKAYITLSNTPYDISAMTQANLSPEGYSFSVDVAAEFTTLDSDDERKEEDPSYTPTAKEIGDPQIAIESMSSVADSVSSVAQLFEDAQMGEMALRAAEGFAQGIVRPPSVDLSSVLDALNQIIQAIQFGGVENP